MSASSFAKLKLVFMVLLLVLLWADVEMKASSDTNLLAEIMQPGYTKRSEHFVELATLAPNIVEYCEAPRAVLQWNDEYPGMYLIACDCSCTSHDNFGWLIDARENSRGMTVQKLMLGRPSMVQDLIKVRTDISDAFSSHPVCDRLDENKISASVFVTLLKRPAVNEDDPYCYYPAYMRVRDGVLGIGSDNDNGVDGYGEDLMMEDDGKNLMVLEQFKTLRGDGDLFNSARD